MPIFSDLASRVKVALGRYRIFRFGIVGIVNTIVGVTAFPILYFLLKPLGVNYIIIMTISYIGCMIFSYTTNRTVVFRSSAKGFVEFFRFSSYSAICYLVNLAVLPFCVEVLHLPPVWVQTGMVFAITISSYLWHSMITFRPRKSQPPASDM